METYESQENYNEQLKPEFRSTENSFFTIFKDLNYNMKNSLLNVVEKDVEFVLTERMEKIIKLIKGEPKITVRKYLNYCQYQKVL